MAKVEINTAEAQPTNEDAIAELKEQGINIETGADADGNRAIATEPNIDAQTIENQRPEWLPEKFKSAEELSKAYSELEKQFSGKQAEPVNEEVKPEGLEIPKDAPSTGFDMGKFADEYADKGELSNNSYNELAKQGLDKGLVDEYIRGQKAIAETHTAQVYNTVGGKEQYAELVDWASKNLTDGEQEGFNDLTATGSIDQVNLAVQGLMTRAGMTNQSQSQPQEMVQGDVNNTSVEQFNSVQQVTEAMNDPRYDKDPVYRKEVERKLGNSSVF
jgi:hypothetical protein